MSQQLVLITGASGHLGFRTLVIALQSGYKVRIALRRLEQADKIKAAKSIQPYLNDIEFVAVPDITAPTAYDEAIKGVGLVIHCASPLFPDATGSSWETLYYKPAQQGTISMLSAAAKEAGVKRVVITSTCLVVEPKNGADKGGPHDLKEVPDEATRNAFTDQGAAYTISKLLAHVASDEFMEKNKPQFDLVRIMPGLLQGANELYESAATMRDPSKLGSNSGTMLTAFSMSSGGGPRPTHQVLLDDVAKAHVLALKPEVAKNGDNFLMAANDGVGMPWEDIVPVIEKVFPEAVAKGILKPAQKDQNFIERYDIASTEKALGYKFAGPEEMVKSVVGQYLKFVEAEA